MHRCFNLHLYMLMAYKQNYMNACMCMQSRLRGFVSLYVLALGLCCECDLAGCAKVCFYSSLQLTTKTHHSLQLHNNSFLPFFYRLLSFAAECLLPYQTVLESHRAHRQHWPTQCQPQALGPSQGSKRPHPRSKLCSWIVESRALPTSLLLTPS